MWEQFITGFNLMFTLQNVLFAVIGVAIGIVVGAIPGLTATMAVALAVPLTFAMPPIPSIAMLVGIYKAGMFGGSISSILINTPGTPAASATSFDGYPMAQKGQALKALKVALYASILGNIVTDTLLVLIAPPLARVAIKLGPPEIFSLILFSITIIATVSGEYLLRGLIAACLGFLFAMVGIDPIAGTARFTFGNVEMLKGIEMLSMLIGIFAISEVLVQVESKVVNGAAGVVKYSARPQDNNVTWHELRSCLKTIIRGSGIGAFIGAIPGLGSTIAAFLSYGMAQRSSKHPERFGKGELEGVAAAESANSGVCGAAMVPLLSLGIPGDVVTAVLMGAFMIQGIAPGPMIFKEHGDIVYAVFIGLYITTVALSILGYAAIRGAWLIFRVPRRVLYPIVIALCVVGSYAVDGSMFDVKVMLLFGLLGYAMRKLGYPLPPLLVAFVLGPMLENSLRQSLIMSHGKFAIFFTRPISLILIILTLVTVVLITRSKLKEG
jgi:putative tricarboxylic transport membrane protein